MTNSTTDAVDHHTHIFSERAHDLFEKAAKKRLPPFTADELVHVLDDDGIAKATVFSVAYMFGASDLAAPDMEGLTAENDWVSHQVALHDSRLVGFFSVNPLLIEAHRETDRWARSNFVGLKLHLANSNVDLREPTHVEKLADVVEHASALGFAIAFHLRTRRPDFGEKDAEIFLDQVISKVPDGLIQIAHLGGWSGYDEATDAALAVLSELIRDPPLYFDISAVVKLGKRTNTQRLAERLRTMEIRRVLFGSDWPEWTPRAYAGDILNSVPLSQEDLSIVLGNCAPWIKC